MGHASDVLVAVVAFLGVVVGGSQNVSKQCPHANITAPRCGNNSTLFAYLNKSKHNKDVSLDNCATCVCAEEEDNQFKHLNRAERGESSGYERSWGRCCSGWNGTRCDICEDLAACPTLVDGGNVTTPIKCTSGEVWPEHEELLMGKKYSCTPCGYDSDNSYCSYTDVPGASLDVVAYEGWAEIAMRVGRYISGGSHWGEHFYHQNFYEYAAMFAGTLESCAFSRQTCAWDSDLECITLSCGETNIGCPPGNLPNCPGYTYDPCTHKYVCEGECVSRTRFGDCCVESDSDDDPVLQGHRYHITQPFCCNEGDDDSCEATEVFWNYVSTTFSCEIDYASGMPAGARRCYLNQEHTGYSTGFPYTCHVGNCIYNSSAVISVDDDQGAEAQARVATQLVALAALAIALGVGVLSSFAASQLRRRANKIKSASDGFEFFKSDASPYSSLLLPEQQQQPQQQQQREDGGGDDEEDPLGLPEGSSDASADRLPPPECPGQSLNWRNVRVRCGRFDALRGGVSGSAARGAVTAILGPSGAGKSSLLRALGGRLATDSVARGDVFLCGEALDAGRRRSTMAFVPQDDAALPAALTVKEHLLFHATLRRFELCRTRLSSAPRGRARSYRRTDAEDAVRAVVSALDLGDCACRVIGQRADDDDGADAGERGISGGEARRVSVAAELLGEPSVVLLDEPTSRLDARAALSLAVSLRRVARGGALSSGTAASAGRRSVVVYPVVLASMHQPRAEIFYEALDSILLLARGRVAWAGNVDQATELAATRTESTRDNAPGSEEPPWPVAPNPADVLMDAVDEAVSTLGARRAGNAAEDDDEAIKFRKAVATALQLVARREPEEEEEVARPESSLEATWAPAPVGTQLLVLVERQLIRAARAPSLLLLHVGGSLAAALCLGSIDNDPPLDLGGAQRRVEAIFFSLFFLALLALTALSAFRDDAVVANYERAALGGLYGPLAHFASVVLVDSVALRVLPALVLASIAYPLGGFRRRCAGLCALRFAASLALTSVASGFAALALGSCVASATAANAIGALGVLAMALFGGVAVDVNSGDSNSDVEGASVAHRLSRFVVHFAARCDALYYAFRAAVVGEFAGAKDGVGHPVEYVIDAHKCDSAFHPIPVDVDAILVTLDLPTKPSKADEALLWLALVASVWLVVAALAHWTCSGPRFAADARSDDDDDDDDEDNNRGWRWWCLRDSLPSSRRRRRTPTTSPPATRCCGCILAPGLVEIPAAAAGRNETRTTNLLLPPETTTTSLSEPLLVLEQQQQQQQQQPAVRFALDANDDGDSDDDARDLLHGASSGSQQTTLRSPEVSCGRVTLRVVEWRATAKASVRAVVKVLDDCAFSAAPATVTALLGPSGAGKSSLLDVLAGRRTTGKLAPESVVSIDGVATSARDRRRLSRYVPQDDVLPPRLTAAEHLAFHGRLRLPRSWSDARKVRAAMREARRLGLSRSNDFDATKVLLSRASGGQRRRISLATELVAKTRLFFCDEPTTGLDAATALLACRRLRRVSRRGVTVVAVLHQPRPEIFFDLDVVALVVGGKVAFVGSPNSAARTYLGEPSRLASINPADAMLDAVATRSRKKPRYDGNRMMIRRQRRPPEEEHPEAEEDEKDGDDRRPRVVPRIWGASSSRRWSSQTARLVLWQEAPSSWDMFRLLADREARAVSRDCAALVVHFLPAIAIGALLGIVYEDIPSKDDTAAGIMDRYGLAFILSTTVGLLALSAAPRSRRAARLFGRERDALRDFAFPSFAASAYVGDAIPLRLAPPTILAFIAARLSRCCQTRLHLLGFVAAVVQLHYALAAVGRAVGAVAPRDGVSSGCSALVLLFSLLLCGFFVSPNDLPNPPWKQIATLFPASYAYEALNAHMFADVDELFIVSKVGGNDVSVGPFNGQTILNCFGLDGARQALAKHLVLAIFGAAADLLTFFAFKLFARERR
ncbi:hypothetical protein CTAYLR_006116 [Chrysophaeum taylorii]|uniref:ABC transporter domain-containing protein n=1 Tax=Chrysophaeum taylorii TaxID=2483200 RepID=A0AAD7UB86_9STRA|nr:hypothetical protein CTAYLR_006116 [Chrysophaeum taylorii]